MARRLRWKRVIGAVVVLVLFIGLVCFGLLKACGKDEGEGGGKTTESTVANDNSQGENSSSDSGENNSANNGGNQNNSNSGESNSGGSNNPTVSWPSAISGMVKEYSGAGTLIAADTSTSDDGKTVYKMKYKGTSIDSCFSYSKNTLGIKGEWTEAVTGELYTFSRETDKYVLTLNCEPKAQNGYDLLVSVKVK